MSLKRAQNCKKQKQKLRQTVIVQSRHSSPTHVACLMKLYYLCAQNINPVCVELTEVNIWIHDFEISFIVSTLNKIY